MATIELLAGEKLSTTEDAEEKTPSVSSLSSVVESSTPPPLLTSLDSKPYRPKMSLSGLGQPYVSAGGGMFGSFFRAGMSLGLSDLFEARQLQTAVQVGGSVADFAVQTAYINRQSRWNWAVIGGQIPIVIGDSRFIWCAATIRARC